MIEKNVLRSDSCTVFYSSQKYGIEDGRDREEETAQSPGSDEGEFVNGR